MLTLTINGKKVKAKEGTTLLELCRQMSIPVPTLCYHPDLSPHGSCRLCTIEVRKNGRSRMVTACNYPAENGIVVETHSERVTRARRLLVELLLARSPHAPILQQLAEQLGVEGTPFTKRTSETDCILCGLCVRTCRELVGADAIGFSMRGTVKKVGTPFEIDSERCVACGACEYICPTGTIKMEMSRVRKMRMSDVGTLRACRYVRMGLIDFMICSNGFECWRCEVDQRMEDRFGTHPIFALKPGRQKEPFVTNGFTFHPELYYSQNHLWCKAIERFVKVGLDEIASLLALGAEGLDLPPAGALVKENGILAEISSSGGKIEILSPFEGTVSAVNPDVLENPSLIWRDPYRRGWLLLLEPDRPERILNLLSGPKAREWYARQASRLFRHLMKWVPNPLPKGALLEHPSFVETLRKKRENLRKIILGA